MPAMSVWISVAAGVGICLATYALYVEYMKAADETFQAGCDIEWLGASCSSGKPGPSWFLNHAPGSGTRPRRRCGLFAPCHLEHNQADCPHPATLVCFAVFASEYGRMLSKLGLVSPGSSLDLPNAANGLIFYLAVLILPSIPASSAVREAAMLGAALLSAAASAYLGYVLAFILGDFCVVCVSTYAVNAVILGFALTDFLNGRAKAKRS